MSDEEIGAIIEMVRTTAMARHPWLSELRLPTPDEVERAQIFCELYPTKEQETDRTTTVVLYVI